jgi:cytoskeletal protein CcmA (bactofilin family)
MAFSDFAKGGRDSENRTTTGTGALTAFIDQGSEFSGKLSFKDTVRIDGRFEGEISSQNTLIVGETGRVQATIVSEVVVVSGEVKGDIVARKQLTVHRSGKVDGNVRARGLVVEEGAAINGSIEMGERAFKDSGEKKAPAAAAKG